MVVIQGFDIGATGYGLMGLTVRSVSLSEDQAFSAMKAAINTGAVFWNGGEFYGPPDFNSLHLLHKYFTKYPEDADKVFLSIKGALKPDFSPDTSPEGIKRSVENCVKILSGVKKIDLFEPARVDPTVPIEETMHALLEMVKEGKIGSIGLSEAKPDIIRRAHGIHPIAAVEIELSLWAQDAIEKGVTATCAELGIPLVAYSPMGNGMLTGKIKKLEDIPDGDYRKILPRFQGKAFYKNLELVDALEKFAQRKGCTPAQLALSWVRNLSGTLGMPQIVPIPGAATAARVGENTKIVPLSVEEEREIQNILNNFEVIGGRYPEHMQAFVV